MITNSVNFKASYIDAVKIKRLDNTIKYSDYYVSMVKLSTDSFYDSEVLKCLDKNWKKRFKNSLTEGIYFDFNNNKNKNEHNYYAITTQKDNFDRLRSHKILGIVEYTHDSAKKYDYIDYIQVNPKYMNKNRMRYYKDIGKSMLDFLKNTEGFNNIYLNALKKAIKFYQKNGFELVQGDVDEPLMRFCRKWLKP